MDDMQIKRSVVMVIQLARPSRRAPSTSPHCPVRERPYSEAKQDYEKQLIELTDWISRARHYAQAIGMAALPISSATLNSKRLVRSYAAKLPVPDFRRSRARHPQCRRILRQTKMKMILAGWRRGL
jgi:hypothetical protein